MKLQSDSQYFQNSTSKTHLHQTMTQQSVSQPPVLSMSASFHAIT